MSKVEIVASSIVGDIPVRMTRTRSFSWGLPPTEKLLIDDWGNLYYEELQYPQLTLSKVEMVPSSTAQYLVRYSPGRFSACEANDTRRRSGGCVSALDCVRLGAHLAHVGRVDDDSLLAVATALQLAHHRRHLVAIAGRAGGAGGGRVSGARSRRHLHRWLMVKKEREGERGRRQDPSSPTPPRPRGGRVAAQPNACGGGRACPGTRDAMLHGVSRRRGAAAAGAGFGRAGCGARRVLAATNVEKRHGERLSA